MISVIVPAHNEASVIGRCLRALCEGAEPGELDIVVVCNGCTDDTEAIARSFGEPVRVLATETASKTASLNLGDEVAQTFPRFYLDADVRVTVEALRQVAEPLREGHVLAAAPRIQIDWTRSSWAVRSFYRIWTELPYFHNGMIGAGLYGLSEEGRARFEAMPPIIADDEFVRLHFHSEERLTVESARFTVYAPTTLASLVRIKTRSRLGVRQLAMRHPEIAKGDSKSYRPALARLISKPTLWPCMPAYIFVQALARHLAGRRVRAGRFDIWDRDDTSRATGLLGDLPARGELEDARNPQ